MKRIVNLLVAIAICMSCALSASAQLPSVYLKDLKGNKVNTTELTKDGNPVVISFFATWCKPCMRELKAIAEVYEDWQDETGMKMYIVSIDEAQNTSKVKPLVDAEGWSYDVLLDENKELFNAIGGQIIPHVLVLDGQGKIVYNHSGYTDGGETEIIEKIRSLKSDK